MEPEYVYSMINHDLFFQMDQSDIQRVKEQLTADLKNYYRDMGEVAFE